VSYVHFVVTEYSTGVRDFPHSKQDAFNRDVIKPQEGQIV